MKFTRACRECSTEFNTPYRNAQLCSDRCREVRKVRQDREWREDRVSSNLQILKEYVGGEWKCQDCGTIYPEMRWLDWHHIDPALKVRPVSTLLERVPRIVMTEAVKCKLLCPNCHRKIHIEMRRK